MNIPFNISQREKKFLLIGGIVIFLILIYHVFSWYSEVRSSQREYIEAKRITLQKQFHKISGKENLLNNYEILSNNLKVLEKGLLTGTKPPVVAAEIQRLLKEMASSLEIDIKTERALNPEDRGLYLGIPVELGFTTTTGKLKQLLYKIKTSTFILTISEIKVRVTNIRNPVNSYVTLVVRGFIKKPRINNKDEKKG